MIMSYGFESLIGNLLLVGIVIGIPIVAIIAFFVGVYSFYRVKSENKLNPDVFSDKLIKEKKNNLIIVIIILAVIAAFYLLCNWLALNFPG